MNPSEEKQLELSELKSAAECLKALAHPHRLLIVQLLLSGEKLSVNAIAEACELSQPSTSDHLRLMQRCGFLDSQRSGRTVYYRVVEPHLEKIMSCIQQRFGASAEAPETADEDAEPRLRNVVSEASATLIADNNLSGSTQI